MSYNDKKNDSMEIDDLNIKSHLNTSLDLSGISVSEDLINRTLAAIKEQSVSSQEEGQEDGADKRERKVLPWNKYVRGVAGIAAAAIVAVIGINYINHMPMEKKSEIALDSAMPKSADNNDTGGMQESAAQQTESAEGNDETSASLYNNDQEEQQFTITAEAFLNEGSSDSGSTGDVNLKAAAGLVNGNTEEPKKESAAVEAEEEENREMGSVVVEDQKASSFSSRSEGTIFYSFREIFIPSPEQAQYITISDDRKHTTITLTRPEDIEAFYLAMDSHQFSAEGTDSQADPNYTVEMNSPELGMLYTMEVGSNLTVRYSQGENVVEMIYYAVDDSRFKSELAEFYIEYSE